MNNLRSTALAATLLAALSAPAQAATPLGDYFSIGGFGTLGGVATNTDAAQYGHDRQSGGADKHPTMDVDSNLGLQLEGRATNWLSATVQTLSAKREDIGFATRIEWAYVLVKPLDGLSIRGGRMATPTFLISDSRNVGYANNWLRAPNEAYGLDDFHTYEGGEIAYRKSFGSVSITASALAGKTSFRTNGFDATGSNLRGLHAEVETEWATFRIGRVQAKTTIAAFQVFDDPYSFTGYGVSVDRDNIVAQAEFVQRRSSGSAGSVNSDGWYVTGGYRFNTVLPYAIISRTSPLNKSEPYYITNTQRTTALGVRWDAFKSADLKFQVDRVGSNGTAGASFTTPTRDARVPDNVMVYSVAMDFIF